MRRLFVVLIAVGLAGAGGCYYYDKECWAGKCDCDPGWGGGYGLGYAQTPPPPVAHTLSGKAMPPAEK
jgi:hypothetical protein